MPSSVIIGDTPVKQFNNFRLTKAIDRVGSTFSFRVPFYPDDATYRELYKPFTYPRAILKINGETQLTGRVEKLTPSLDDKTEVIVSGRALPGVLVDVTFQKSDFPIQFEQAALDEIAESVVKNYDFKAVFDDAPGAIFEEAGANTPAQTVFSFLQNLARQRKLLMSQTPDGDLLFRRALTVGAPVAELIEGDVGVVVTTGSYDGTARFSSFDGFGQEPDVNDNYARVVDPALDGIRRPKSLQANDTNSANILEAVEWAASATIANAIDIPLRIAGWTDSAGRIWTENSLITLTAPSIMIYKPFNFLVKSVRFEQDDSQEVTSLGLTIPGAYSGQLPKAYPWG